MKSRLLKRLRLSRTRPLICLCSVWLRLTGQPTNSLRFLCLHWSIHRCTHFNNFTRTNIPDATWTYVSHSVKLSSKCNSRIRRDPPTSLSQLLRWWCSCSSMIGTNGQFKSWLMPCKLIWKHAARMCNRWLKSSTESSTLPNNQWHLVKWSKLVK